MTHPIRISFALFLLPLSALACIQGSSRLPKVKPMVVPLVPATKDLAPKIDFAVPVLPELKFGSAAAREETPSASSEDEARAVYRNIIAAYEAKNGKERSVEETTDYAAALIFIGRTQNAISTLLSLERRHPGLYTTAANLGTAYELAGNVPKALRWIKEGMARNPASHAGTEWLHVAILEAKLRLRDDANWLATHSVLDVSPSHSPSDVIRAIEYQLNERLRFIAPTDLLVADLFYQAAIRLTDPARADQRALYLQESLRFGDLRKAQIAKLGTLKA